MSIFEVFLLIGLVTILCSISAWLLYKQYINFRKKFRSEVTNEILFRIFGLSVVFTIFSGSIAACFFYLGAGDFFVLFPASMLLLNTMLIAIDLIKWLFRSYHAGYLILAIEPSANSKSKRVHIRSCIMNIISTIFLVFLFTFASPNGSNNYFFTSILPFFILYFSTSSICDLVKVFSKLELREHGLCGGLCFLPWERIESYFWEPSQPSMLKIHYSSVPFISIPVQSSLSIPPDDLETVNQILGNKLTGKQSSHEVI